MVLIDFSAAKIIKITSKNSKNTKKLSLYFSTTDCSDLTDFINHKSHEFSLIKFCGRSDSCQFVGLVFVLSVAVYSLFVYFVFLDVKK